VPNAQVPPVSTVGKPGNTARKQGNKAQWPASLTGYPTHVTFSYPARVVGATACHPPSPAQPCHAMPHHATRQRLPGTYHSRLPGSSDRSCHARPCHAMPCHITPRYPEEVTRHLSRSVTRLKRPVVPASHAMPCQATSHHVTYPALITVGYPAEATGRASHAMPCHITPRYPAEVTRHLSRSVTWLKRPATYLAMRPTMIACHGMPPACTRS
jgi:hypothetical protein